LILRGLPAVIYLDNIIIVSPCGIPTFCAADCSGPIPGGFGMGRTGRAGWWAGSSWWARVSPFCAAERLAAASDCGFAGCAPFGEAVCVFRWGQVTGN
jgi:hypothetical protein